MESAESNTPINVREIIVEIPVSSMEKSKEWYAKVFGKKPDLEPFPGNIEFKIGGGWVQIVESETKSPGWSLNLEVYDLDLERERLRNLSIIATEIKTHPDVIKWFDLKDPDENFMRWFQVLTTDSTVTENRED